MILTVCGIDDIDIHESTISRIGQLNQMSFNIAFWDMFATGLEYIDFLIHLLD